VLTGASSECVEGVCELLDCLEGSIDLDGVAANGCEHVCVTTGPESCNGVDDDCNGTVDDGGVCSGGPVATGGANSAGGDGCTCQAARAPRSTSVGLLLGFFALTASTVRRRRNQVRVA
jgi:MYXO-CTERM domain-containing protein